MAHQNIEIEIQVNVEHLKPLTDFLEKSGFFKSEKHQIDEYFTPFHRDFLAVRPAVEWLRLRDNNGTYMLNYKNWHLDEEKKSHYCDEYETKISDIGSARKIFESLNMKSLIKVDKSRKIWEFQDYEIALDSVKGLGDFIEIEYIGREEKDPKEVTNGMVSFLKQIGCGKIRRNYSGYPFLLLFPEDVRYEDL